MTNQVGFGIIGAGMIASWHAEAIKSLANCRLAGVYDPVFPAAQILAEKFGCQSFDSLDKLLACKDIQAVTIATPSGMHGKLSVAAANAQKHIFCEKPLEITVEKADEIIRACEKNNVLLTPVFQSRFSEPVKKIKAAIDQGRFGKMLLASVQMHWFRADEYYSRSNWRGTWAMDGGGALMNQAVHMIDLLLYLNGEPEEVAAFSGTLTHNIEVEDNLCAAIKYRNGSFGTVEVSTSCAPGFPRRLELAGSNGSVVLEEDKITRWQFSDPLPGDECMVNTLSEISAGGGSAPGNISIAGHAAQLNDFADAILNGKPLFLNGQEGRRAVELICGIYEAAKNGKNVRFTR